MYSLLPDEFAFDPRVIKAGPEAIALYVRALARVAQKLSDGLLTPADVQMLCVYDAPCLVQPVDLAAVLVSVGLWETVGGGWRVVDYLAHNMSAAQYAEWRDRQAAGGRRGGATRAQTGVRDQGGRFLPQTSPQSTLVADPEPDPDRPRPRPGASNGSPMRYLSEPEPDGNEWEGWEGAEWQPFLTEWRLRFRRPPTRGQRAALWDVIDSRPSDAATWVKQAPIGAKAAAVVGHVLRQWRDYRSS
jgi:hypothetical protein